ncbi:MAG: dihydrofolate reductase [Dysgonamonadaceae bacterium]|jgi:dihydrofolate reductase|nr:dihydrofolate reductase [Dysgonamonadaceae bacterium]
MITSIIVALGENNEIGKDGKLLCRLPADLKHFKEITWGHTVIMGRKTFESLPEGPLPNRKNIVLSRNRDLKIEGAKVYRTLNSALVYLLNENEVFIIGGAQIYEQILPIVDKIYLTKIHAVFPDADAFFPPVSMSGWKEIKRETFPADEKNPYPYSFIELAH